jgi:hypothetical protein
MKREFKEEKKANIEAGWEQGESGLEQGEQRAAELQEVRSLIDSARAEARDEETRAALDGLQQSFLEKGREAYQREVKETVDSAHSDLEQNKNDISVERYNVGNAINDVSNMQGITDLASGEARNVQKELENSAGEYDAMVNQTNEIETTQEARSDNIARRIESILA